MPPGLIRVNEETKGRLKSLKEHPGETYCDVIERLIDMAVDDEPLSDETLKGIEEGLSDLKAGRVRPLEDIAKEMGI
jgi:predicted transcriptional regulator